MKTLLSKVVQWIANVALNALESKIDSLVTKDAALDKRLSDLEERFSDMKDYLEMDLIEECTEEEAAKYENPEWLRNQKFVVIHNDEVK